MEPVITLTAKGPEGIGKTLLLNAITDFLSVSEIEAPASLALFRKVYGPMRVVVLAEEGAPVPSDALYQDREPTRHIALVEEQT